MLRVLCPPPASIAPVFTLASALRWLGHECSNPWCATQLGALPASMWFVWSDRRCPGSPPHTVVVVDPGDGATSPVELAAHLAVINDCLRHEADCVDCAPRAITAAGIVAAPHPR